MWLSTFPNAICWKDRHFTIEWSWHSYQKSFEAMIYFCTLYSIPLVYMCVFTPVPQYLYLLCFVVSFESVSVVLQLCSFSRVFLVLRVLWDSKQILGWVFLFLQDMSLGFLQDFLHWIQITLDSIGILIRLWTWTTFPFVSVFLTFFQQCFVVFMYKLHSSLVKFLLLG